MAENGLCRLVWAILVLVALLAAVSCGGPAGEGSVETSTGNGGADLGHPSRGDANAPVVMIEYGDYQ